LWKFDQISLIAVALGGSCMVHMCSLIFSHLKASAMFGGM
jgi:hypothetical protein